MTASCITLFINLPDNSREVSRPVPKPTHRLPVGANVILKGDEVEHGDSTLETLLGRRKTLFRQTALQGTQCFY